MDQRPWNAAELRFCVENRGKLTCRQMADHLNRTPVQVRKALQRWRQRMRAKGVEVQNLACKWTAEEKRFVKENRLTMSVKRMARALGKNYHQVKGFVARLRQERRPGARFRLKKRPVAEWVAEYGDRVRSLHGKGYSDPDIAKQIPGMADSTVFEIRKRLGLPSNIHSERQRAKLSRWARENMQFRVANMLEAERLGWPGRSLGEARTLSALAESGPLTREELSARLGIKWGTGANSLSQRVYRLQKEGLVTNGDGRYRLAPGVNRQPTYGEDEEDEL
jgi:chromosome segregation and condensation protein ScpB